MEAKVVLFRCFDVISNIDLFVPCQDGIMERGYVMELWAGFLPITLRKYSMNTSVPAIYVSGIDC